MEMSAMNIQKRISTISEMLLFYMLFVVVITAIFFAGGVSIGYINFFMPLILMVIFRYRFLGDMEFFLQDCIGSLFVLAIFIAISGCVYDNTWDGAAYHKTAVGLLKEGWNPFYIDAIEYNNIIHSIEPARDNPLLWAEAYPKATWYFASTVYYLTGNIECGKCYTLIFAFITFGICIEYFSKKVGTKKAYILSLVTALNPIVCAQFQTYYLDGVVASTLTMLIVKFLEILEGLDDEQKGKTNLSIFALIIWGCNMKFNTALYIATICGIYCICLSLQQKKLQIKETFLLIGEGIISIFLIGFAPYITNYIRQGDIFYGFVGLLNEEAFQKEFGIEGLNGIERFWTSVLGRTSHGQYSNLGAVLKIPFTFNNEELNYYRIPDVRVGGFGIMFSGLFIIAVVVVIIMLMNKIKRKIFDISSVYIFLLLLVSLIEFCIIPQTSQFRYIPHFYLMIVYALYSIIKNSNKKKLIEVLSVFYMAMIIVNTFPWAKVAILRTGDSIRTTATLQYLQENSENNDKNYLVSFFCDDFTGMFYNLKDYDIQYSYINIADVDQEFKVTFLNRLYYKEVVK